MYTHFHTEFVRQNKALILPRLTMTQFMFVIVSLVVGIGMLNLPWWMAPLLMVLAYAAGHDLRGEMVWMRLLVYAQVRARQTIAHPRVVNIESQWQKE
ncbi:MAG: hypothetical protein IPM39_27280 [Chloroflexi bacterium]|nr:hypothetical protein [Chloroflexota bacterium]